MMTTAHKFGLVASVVVVAVLLSLLYLGAPRVGDRAPANESAISLPPPDGVGLLVYAAEGDIYLAEADGSNPRRVAEDSALSPGSTWSPDGLHFLYGSSDGKYHISDADGRVVTSFAPTPAFGVSFSRAWSPDSTRLLGWTTDGTQIAVYDIDGRRQTSLSLPDGYRRLYEIGALWAPDGRSVIAAIQPGRNNGEVWELPIDGSAPRQLANDDPLSHSRTAISPDGSRVAYAPRDAFADGWLYVANADGTDTRRVAAEYPALLSWSPSGTRLAFYDGSDLMVLDAASGAVMTAVPELGIDGYPPYGWSSAGDRLLFLRPNRSGESLWSVSIDGTDQTVLVEGASWGEWQPVATTKRR